MQQTTRWAGAAALALLATSLHAQSLDDLKRDSATPGDVLTWRTGTPLDVVQVIDARDLAEFIVRCAEDGTVGTYNVTIYANGDSVDSKNFAVKK